MSHRLMQNPAPARPELDALLKKAAEYTMTPAERFEQAVSFVYGNLPEENKATKDEVRANLMGSPLSFATDYRAWRNRNTYDSADRVRQESLIRAGGVKLASYRVRDPETGEFGKLQFHMTMDDTIIAVIGESAAILFANFIAQQLPDAGWNRPKTT